MNYNNNCGVTQEPCHSVKQTLSTVRKQKQR